MIKKKKPYIFNAQKPPDDKMFTKYEYHTVNYFFFYFQLVHRS